MSSRFWRAGGNAILPNSNFLADVASGFTPTSLTNLAAWYDADQQTETADAGVATFVDRSGHGNDFTQPTGTAQPLLRYSSINGKKALDFDGSTSVMTCATGLLNSASAGAWFAVIKQDADPPTSEGPVLDNFTSGSFSCHHPFSDGVIYDGFGLTARNTCGNPTPSLTSTSMLAAIAGPGDYRFLVNNGTLFSSASGTIGFGTGTRWLGKAAGGAFFLGGLVAELIICNAVPSAGDIANIRSYFNAKYGTSF